MGFRVGIWAFGFEALAFAVWGVSGLGVLGLGIFWLLGLGFGVQGSGLWVKELGPEGPK